MSKRPTQPDDWSDQSAALFESVRAVHAPTATDRARVRSGLSQKLAAVSGAPAAGGDVEPSFTGTAASHAALGNLVKVGLGLGLACVMAGAFVFTRANDRQNQAPAKSLAPQLISASAKQASHVSEPDVIAKDVAATSSGAPAPAAGPRAQDALPARTAPRRFRAQSVAPKDSTVAVPLLAGRQPESAVVEPAPASVDEPASASARAAAVVPADRTTTVEDTTDARAELAFVARISAAARTSKPQIVLALCAEHERRWPHGTFEQEREGLRAIAACDLKAIDAVARAQKFLERYPRAPLAARVREECAP